MKDEVQFMKKAACTQSLILDFPYCLDSRKPNDIMLPIILFFNSSFMKSFFFLT